jgi:hypothetical protein
MKRTKKKHEAIKLNLKESWEVGRGHTSYRGGAGNHDNRPKRQRTRQNILKQALKDG